MKDLEARVLDCLARSDCIGVSIKCHEAPCRAEPCEQPTAVPSSSEGEVCIDAVWLDGESFEGLLEQDRLMGSRWRHGLDQSHRPPKLTGSNGLLVGRQACGIPDFKMWAHAEQHHLSTDAGPFSQNGVDEDTAGPVNLGAITQAHPESPALLIRLVVSEAADPLSPEAWGHEQQAAVVTL